MLASGRPLYGGVTKDLRRRVFEHKIRAIKGFTSTYGVTRFVWYEACEQIAEAMAREKELRKWRWDWKIRLIEEMNPEWGISISP